MFFYPQRVIAMTIHCPAGKTPEISNAGKSYIHKLVKKIIHPSTAKRDHAADGHAFPQLLAS